MTNTKLLIVADDFTGGLDTGVQFARGGIATRIVINPKQSGEWTETDGQVLECVSKSINPSEKRRNMQIWRKTKRKTGGRCRI